MDPRVIQGLGTSPAKQGLRKNSYDFQAATTNAVAVRPGGQLDSLPIYRPASPISRCPRPLLQSPSVLLKEPPLVPTTPLPSFPSPSTARLLRTSTPPDPIRHDAWKADAPAAPADAADQRPAGQAGAALRASYGDRSGLLGRRGLQYRWLRRA